MKDDSVVNTGDATVETVLASLVDAEVETATADVSDSADLGTVSENTRLPPVIPSEPTLLLCPTPVTSEVQIDKKLSRDVIGLKLGTLAELITNYSQNDRTERVFELALAAELTMSLLATDFANTVTDFILAGHPLLKRDVDERIVTAVNASHATKTVPVENASIEASKSAIAINIDLSDASAVVADVLNSIVNTVDGGTTTDVTLDPSVKSEDSADGCGFAIVEKEIVVKSENDLKQSAGQKDPGVKTFPTESEAHQLKNRFLTAARWFDVHGEKCLHLEHLKMILNSSARLLSPGAVKDAVKRVCEDEVFQYEACLQ
uniref:Uncharacterized protein n=1 Tax=Spumella elongata TaxID=89044 RepID=A0A7S3MA29_9STRA